jgi:hypothetical protein
VTDFAQRRADREARINGEPEANEPIVPKDAAWLFTASAEEIAAALQAGELDHLL